MKSNIKVYFVMMIAVFGFTQQGQAQEAISLSDCKQQALEHNQTVKAKRANYTASEASLKLSQRASLPNFDVEASYLYQNDPMTMKIPGYELPTTMGIPSGVYSPESNTQLQYNNTYNANIGLSLPLYVGGKIAEGRKIANNAMAIAASDIALSKTDVLLSIEQQYWTLVSLIEIEKVSAKSISFLSDVVTDMNNRYVTGVVTKNEVLKATVELNNAELSHITISNNIELLKMALNQSVGREINTPLSIVDSAIDILVDVASIEERAQNLDKRHEIQMLTQMNEIYKSEKKIDNADYLPQLVSFANYQFQNPNHLSQEEGELTWTAGVSLTVPVFHWGERGLKNKQAEMKIASGEYQLDQTKELLTLEIHQSIFKLKESMMKLEFTRVALEQSEENLSLETNRLQEEVSTTTDFLNAQMQWQKAESDFISAKTNVKISEAKYKKAIGELNP